MSQHSDSILNIRTLHLARWFERVRVRDCIRLNVAMMDIKLDTLLASEVNYPLAGARLPPGARTDI